jgi:hypothetical protein
MVMGMYESPIKMLTTDMHQIVKQQDEEIYKAVLHFIPYVDKNELIRALQYDRNQYEKGYVDGKADAMAEVVRCKDCEHRGDYMVCPMCFEEQIEWDDDGYSEVDWIVHDRTLDEGFCDRGERRTDETNTL